MRVLNCLVERSAHNRHKHIYEDDVSEKCGEHKDSPNCVYVFSIEKFNTIKLPKPYKPLVNQRSKPLIVVIAYSTKEFVRFSSSAEIKDVYGITKKCDHTKE